MARTRQRPPATDPVQELLELARDLDLTALADTLPALLHTAQEQSPSFTDFTLGLLRVERDARTQRGLKRSHLGEVEGLDGFDFAARPKLDPRVVKELMAGRFIAEHRNVLCLGQAGLGKTRIAKAIAHAACLAGYSVLCVVTADMLEDLHASQADATFRRALRRYLKPDLLLCD